VLDSIGELRSDIGRITIGVMIAQDIAVVPILVFVESMGGASVDPGLIAVKIVLAIVLLVALIIWLSRRGKIAVGYDDHIAGRIDLLTLWVLALCFSAAALSGALGLSPAYGAFCAGLLMSSSTIRAEAIRVTEPIQSVLLVVFFLSVGLLIDIDYVWANIGIVAAFTIVVLAVKSLLNVALLRLVGEPLERALPAGLIMAQIGELSFILVALGLKNGVLDPGGQRLGIAVIAASLLISPLWANAVQRFHAMTFRRIHSLREALSEAYSEELIEVERGTEAVSVAARGLRRRARRTRRAIAIARARRRAPKEIAAVPAEGAVDAPEPELEPQKE
jgi:CPA2 family monovalent cation:H+ antiporter-2